MLDASLTRFCCCAGGSAAAMASMLGGRLTGVPAWAAACCARWGEAEACCTAAGVSAGLLSAGVAPGLMPPLAASVGPPKCLASCSCAAACAAGVALCCRLLGVGLLTMPCAGLHRQHASIALPYMKGLWPMPGW